MYSNSSEARRGLLNKLQSKIKAYRRSLSAKRCS
ncbi:hypothetical protein VPHD528_0213 [Vibrio phage D528]